jgi:hypothetical protein
MARSAFIHGKTTQMASCHLGLKMKRSSSLKIALSRLCFHWRFVDGTCMQLLRALLISFLLILASCQSNVTAKPLRNDKVVILHPDAPTLEKVNANWNQILADTYRREPSSKIVWQEEIHRICIKEDSLCEYSVRSSKRREQFDRKLVREIKHNLEDSNFDEIKNYSVDFGLKFFSKLKQSKLLDYADVLLLDKECRTTDFRHALASALEDHLPDVQAKEAVQLLYESNSECPSSKTMALSSYRAAMLRLVDQDCLKATPLLQKVTSSTEDYLKPRSMYWTWKCLGESAEC